MTVGMSPPRLLTSVSSLLANPRFVNALTTAIIAVAVCSYMLRQTIGWAGLIGILAALVVLATGSILARRESIQWRGLLPISLLVFAGWAGASIFWSEYRWVTLASLAYFVAFTVLGLYAALVRDTIQIVRVYGDVLRFALGLSLAIEVVAGVLIDTPISFLGVLGRLDELGPLQGIVGARNQLGILAVLALVTFAIELRTRSVPRGLAVGSLVVAGFALALSRSPVALGASVVVIIAAAALYGLRHAKLERQRFWQIGLLAATVVSGIVVWAFRGTIVTALNASGELSYRLDVWSKAWELVALHPLEGWGWVGRWHAEVAPFTLFEDVSSRTTNSASNAFVDVWFQLGFVGFALFVGVVGLAFVRSWLLASRRRSVVYTWPSLVLVVLVTTALAESSLLVEFGWLTFVVCSVKAAGELSWRQAFVATGPAEPDES